MVTGNLILKFKTTHGHVKKRDNKGCHEQNQDGVNHNPTQEFIEAR
jgi:hypothetical protein